MYALSPVCQKNFLFSFSVVIASVQLLSYVSIMQEVLYGRGFIPIAVIIG